MEGRDVLSHLGFRRISRAMKFGRMSMLFFLAGGKSKVRRGRERSTQISTGIARSSGYKVRQILQRKFWARAG
jgi:hypothetical protein